ncbi:hypothetical protein VFPPC_11393 [Pochonia chlamydosporia 170]|uniref:Ubiquinol-cytochrome-c reductase cytochrome c1 n=1 Tax=Pochonia chlamydosporia 170 TaxID=1380566 RepID=A0A179EYV4_METCM|nr:hypothetical protein VFPPC_11393 [Pochonia chlamydosporia 170]OAQ58079.1 hypothetical protein VFPPC_11393 [Pochonia chlamydosporia 170]
MSAEDRYPERIYIALRHVFHGQAAKLQGGNARSKRKAIRKLVNEYLDCDKDNTLKDIVDAHGMTHITSIAGDFLSKGIFDSTCLASQRFPELSHTPGLTAAGVELVEVEGQSLLGPLGDSDLLQSQRRGGINEPTQTEPLKSDHSTRTSMASTEDLYSERVYVALRHVFVGKNAKLRKKKPIRKLVNSYLSTPEGNTLKDIVEAHGVSKLVAISRTLIVEGIFESACLASQRFPEWFSAISATVTIPNTKDARNNSPGPTEGGVVVRCQRCGRVPGIGGTIQAKLPCNLDGIANGKSPCTIQIQSKIVADDANESGVSTFTIRLPFEAQHELMVHLQRVMEQVCFDFAKQALPDLLGKRRWACAMAVELHLWKDVLLQQRESLPAGYELSTASLEPLLQTMAFIRHVAVVRIDISATQLQKCMEEAVELTEALGQMRFLSALRSLQKQINSEILGLRKEEELQRHLLDLERSTIANERADLDVREERAIQSAEQKLAVCQIKTGSRIHDIIGTFQDIILAKPDTVIKSEVSRDRRNISGEPDSDQDLDFCSLPEQAGVSM